MGTPSAWSLGGGHRLLEHTKGGAVHTKRVTLETIARRLGLSKYSVSRALSGGDGVSEATRRNVLEVARELGYRHAAISSFGGSTRTATVSLFLPSDDHQGSEYWLKVMGGVQAEGERLGQRVITRSLGRDVAIGEALFQEAEGVIIAGQQTGRLVGPHVPPGLPKVLIGYPPNLEAVDTVTVADREAGHAVGAHLLGLGHVRVAYVSERRREASRSERYEGLRVAMAGESRSSVSRVWANPEDVAASLQVRLGRLMARHDPPTAFFCSTDVIAFATIRALHQLDLHVPHGASVVGFNDYVESSQSVPTLTTVHVPMHELGVLAMRRLHARLNDPGGEHPFMRCQVVPELVIRRSTGPAPRAGSS